MDTETPAPAPIEPAPPAPVPPRKSWRKRHPVIARTCLYGGMLALFAAGWLVWAHQREAGRQDGLLTKLQGADQIRGGVPELALKIIREDVLAKDPGPDVLRRARLLEAATLDTLERFDEAEAVYARLHASWPAGIPRGDALIVPWATMRVRAKRPAEALALLDAPGATEGASAEEVASVRRWAAKAPSAGSSSAPR